MSKRRSILTAVAGVALVFGLATGAAAHVRRPTHQASSGGVVFFNPVNWPYYECAASEARVVHTRWVSAYTYAFHHSPPGCSTGNPRPPGWLGTLAQIDVLIDGDWYACFGSGWATNPGWAASFGLGGSGCSSPWYTSQVRTYRGFALSGYFDSSSGYWQYGTATAYHAF